MIDWAEHRALIRHLTAIVAMVVAIATLVTYQFTTRSSIESERARARVILESIYNVQQAHFKGYGTYLPSDRGNTSEVLMWSNAPGRFRYSVDVSDSGFVAVATADFNADGISEVWQVDPKNAIPIVVRED